MRHMAHIFNKQPKALVLALLGLLLAGGLALADTTSSGTSGYKLGSLSGQFESGGGKSNFGHDSTGGWSYGTYQIAANTGTMKEYLNYLKKHNPDAYAKLQQAGGVSGAKKGSKQFKDAWASLSNDQSFLDSQHNYIVSTHLNPLLNKIGGIQGLDLDNRSPVVLDVLYSIAVQHGSGGGAKLIKRALGNDVSSLSDAEIINRLYDERSKVGIYFKSSNARVKQSVANRFKRERTLALSLLCPYKDAEDYYAKEVKNVEIDPQVVAILNKMKNVKKPVGKQVTDGIKNFAKDVFNFSAAQSALVDGSDIVGVSGEAIDYMEQLRKMAQGEVVYNQAERLTGNIAQAANGKAYEQYASVIPTLLGTIETSSGIRDSAAKDAYDRLLINLGYAVDYSRSLEKEGKGYLTAEEIRLVEKEAKRLLDVGAENAKKAAEAELCTKNAANILANIDSSTAAAMENSVDLSESTEGRCPPIDVVRSKYQSGCWSCLVVEKLTSSFLNAAKSAYGLSQRAGLTLLWIGAILWLLVWALKNVSSLAQVEPGNILNDLIKFAFKVGLAYWFIMGGLTMVRDYFITPIMGFGATIAQQFWDDKIKDSVEDFKWDTMTDEEIAQQDQELKEILSSPPAPTQEQEENVISTPLSETDKGFLSQNDENFAKTETGIPNLLIPGIQTGCLSSPFGCRVRPCANCSKAHKGVDIGLNCVGKRQWAINGSNCVPVIAAGPGTISYSTQRNKSGKITGAGYYAVINHGTISNHKWATQYFHMRNGSGKFKNGDKVSQGQPIGCVGNTGVGTATHLHFEVIYDDQKIDPMSLPLGKIVIYDWNKCTGKNVTHPEPSKYKYGAKVDSGWPASGKAVVCLTDGATYSGSSSGGSTLVDYGSLSVPIDDVKYTGPTDIMPKAVMNSILGATKAITNITSENMILGDAIMCYSTLDRGGAWHIKIKIIKDIELAHITNAFMWLEGFFIFCFGLLLTMAIIYYLMDLSFKIGFAVIALPIVVGLWPFNLTQDKFSVCVSIIAKAAATFAFFAITTTYTVGLTNAALSYGDMSDDTVAKLYEIMDIAGAEGDPGQENIDYAAAKLSLFSTTFVMLLFAFLYSFKLVQNTVPDLVNKFFPDKAFGDTNPMHQWATAATRWAKDQAMKPVGYARDIALRQVGRLPGKAVGFMRSMVGKGSGDAKTMAGSTMRGAGNVAKGTGKAAQMAGKGVQGIGKGMSAVGKGLQAIPVVGNIVGGAMMAAGKAAEAAGKGVEVAGKGMEKAGNAAKKAGNATDDAYNKFGTRNRKPKNGGDE